MGNSTIITLMDYVFIRNYARIAWLIILGMAILLLDFLSKAYIFHMLPFIEACRGGMCREILIFRDFLGIDFYIGLTINPGAAWGIFADFQLILLAIRILMILGMLIYLFFINQNRYVTAPLVLIIAGALGNIVDFFLYGFVVDFLHFNFWGYHFPVFNLADTSITIGVVWLFFVACIVKNKKYDRIA